MNTTRRRLLQAASAGGAVAGIAGFSALSHLLSPILSGPGDAAAPFSPPTSADIDEPTHLLNRLTFGPRPGDREVLLKMGATAWIDQQLQPEKIDDAWTDARARHFEALDVWPLGELLEYNAKELLDQMTRSKIVRAVHSRRQLQEVMVDFWSDHFNIDPSKGDSKWFKPADDKKVIRAHALGHFRDLVKASALSPSMLWYLDGRLNRRASEHEKPNENYGRELLELHTLGINGGYSQQDVMEAARCLTGWTVRARENSKFAVGKVSFDSDLHDHGAKTVLGTAIPANAGAADLDQLLDIVCNHPSTARHIALKLCRRFIDDQPPEDAVTTVAKAFTDSSGHIPQTLRALFSTNAFRTARGGKIKRPFHFVISTLRATAARTDAGPVLQDYLLRMGHAPFQYPTPDGYPEEAQPWMATLLWRWKFALEFTSQNLKGTRFDPTNLEKCAGGPTPLAAHLLGRKPTDQETTALAAAPNPLALLAASPAFQTF
ncbi:MAG: hypothetical protein JWL81_2225 [Verrucomicrobiales bacterium]|nr:hypothetical protein [Verrucomicrobiales bacterium]